MNNKFFSNSRINLNEITRHYKEYEVQCDNPKKSTGLPQSHSLLRNDRKLKVAFTLAEILITLSILGVIAAITIPNTIQKITDRQIVTAVKRAYSMLDNTIQQMYIIDGFPEVWTPYGYISAERDDFYFFKHLIKYLAVNDYKDYGCCSHTNFFPKSYGYNTNDNYRRYKSFNGNITEYIEQNNGFPVKLKNGMFISQIKPIYYAYKTVNYYPDRLGHIRFRIDVNGVKGPNRYGYDVFFFTADEHIGLLQKETYATSKSENCNINSKVSDSLSGLSCSYWILKHNNMDYKYRDVSSEW